MSPRAIAILTAVLAYAPEAQQDVQWLLVSRGFGALAPDEQVRVTKTLFNDYAKLHLRASRWTPPLTDWVVRGGPMRPVSEQLAFFRGLLNGTVMGRLILPSLPDPAPNVQGNAHILGTTPRFVLPFPGLIEMRNWEARLGDQVILIDEPADRRFLPGDLASVQDVVAGLSQLPSWARSVVTRVVLEPTRGDNPDARGQVNVDTGVLRIFCHPPDRTMPMFVILGHEIGHIATMRLWGKKADTPKWRKWAHHMRLEKTAADVRTEDPIEDAGMLFSRWLSVKGTPYEDTVRAQAKWRCTRLEKEVVPYLQAQERKALRARALKRA